MRRAAPGQQIHLMAFIIFLSDSQLIYPLLTPTHRSCDKNYLDRLYLYRQTHTWHRYKTLSLSLYMQYAVYI